MFSPYYALSGRHDPANHCAINVALYGQPRLWTMTERGRAALRRGPDHLTIGPSTLTWADGGLSVSIDERTAPLPRPVRGRIRVFPAALNSQTFRLDGAGRHRWRPVLPSARVEVHLESPALSWSGAGYFDTNDGDEPMQAAFRRWDWSRGCTADGGTAILYDITPRHADQGPTLLALRSAPDGSLVPADMPPPAPLPMGPAWRVARGTRCDAGTCPRVVETLEDTPFYTRSVVDTALWGERVRSVHESLDLERLRSRWVPWLLPFRMPRIGGR
ncbi:carotenoid 1,2-hydratase [Pararhodospirillum oryzae]|uniref:Carotenoid 1,2-hydratase n=1 Tax=Pararhodospirillum oryzae TaxID=478448 RepID=A0A512H9F2_9PROT|nr:carotenoid 1,2-hydratase [Pararhodospirillum oryzae]